MKLLEVREEQRREACAVWLTVVSGNDRGKRVPITGDRFVVGRDPSCDLVLADPRVSRRHASVDAIDDRVVLRNLASGNGTFVDGRLIDAPLVLQGDERIAVGDTVLLASVDGSPAGADSPEGPGAGADRPPAPSDSALRRLVVDTLREEVKGVKRWSRRATVIRALSGVAGSAAVAILWRILS
jgi:hypothetical protein